MKRNKLLSSFLETLALCSAIGLFFGFIFLTAILPPLYGAILIGVVGFLVVWLMMYTGSGDRY